MNYKLVRNEIRSQKKLGIFMILIFFSSIFSGYNSLLNSIYIIIPMIVLTYRYRKFSLGELDYLLNMIPVKAYKLYYIKLIFILSFLFISIIVAILGKLLLFIFLALSNKSEIYGYIKEFFQSQVFINDLVIFSEIIVILSLVLLFITIESNISKRLKVNYRKKGLNSYLTIRLLTVAFILFYIKFTKFIANLSYKKPLIYLINTREKINIGKMRPELLSSISEKIVFNISGYNYINLRGIIISRLFAILILMLVFLLIRLEHEVKK